MHKPTLLLVGFGQLNRELLEHCQSEFTVVSLSRNPKPGLDHRHLSHDLALAAPNFAEPFDYVVIALSPDGFDESSYRRVFGDGVRHLLDALAQSPPRRLFFVSSTGVYHQQNDEWVDEESPTEPSRFSGRILLQAEQLILKRLPNATNLRLSGIYGGNRTRLIEQVRSGAFRLDSQSGYSNRIHQTDAVSAIYWLLQRAHKGLPMASCYLVTDERPCRQSEVLAWLAEQTGSRPVTGAAPPVGRREVGSKRCSCQRLRETGFVWRYPDYVAGYGEMLARLGIRTPP